MKKPETKFKEKALEDLRGIPGSWWEKIQQVALRGTPDIIGCVRGNFVAIELKKDEKAKVEDLQEHKLQAIRFAGGHAVVAYPENWNEVLMEIRLMAGERT